MDEPNQPFDFEAYLADLGIGHDRKKPKQHTIITDILGDLRENKGNRGHATGTPAANRDISPRVKGYVLAAFRENLRELRATTEGSRNETLNIVAYRLGRFVGAGYLNQSDVANQLEGVALEIGLEYTETVRTIASGLEAGMAEPLPEISLPDREEQQETVLETASGPDESGLPQPVDWSEIFALDDEVDWLVDGVLERGKLYAIYAASKTGKSLFVQYLVAQLVQSGATVMYLDYENTRKDLKDRFDTGMKLTPASLTGLRYYSFPAISPLDTVQGANTLMRLVERDKPDLIIYDTTSRITKGGDNDTDTFKDLNRLTHTPLKSHGITQVRIDHAGKDENKGQRGASGKNDDVDAVLRLAKSEPFNGYVRYSLWCELQRSGHHEGKRDYILEPEPLRFVLAAQSKVLELPPVQKSINEYLDDWQASKDISNVAAHELFKQNGVTVPGGGPGMQAALRERKKRSSRP